MSEESLNASRASPVGFSAAGANVLAVFAKPGRPNIICPSRQAEISALLLGRYRVQAMVEIDGAIPRQHLLEICL